MHIFISKLYLQNITFIFSVGFGISVTDIETEPKYRFYFCLNNIDFKNNNIIEQK
jgi:hypothetical protein